MDFFYERRGDGISFAKRSYLSFSPHIHMHTEIAIVLSGSSCCFIDGEKFRLNEGDAVIVYPNKIHSYEDDGKVSGFVLIAEPSDFPELKVMFRKKEPVCPVVKKEQLENIGFYETLDFAYREFNSGSDAVKRGSVLVVLGRLLSLLELKDENSGDNGIIRDILNYCKENYREKITLSDTAKALHISNGYLSHIFSEKLRMSFTDYINMLRIKDACELLKSSDASITEISGVCGFSSLRTFNRAFLKHIGITPSKYRRE